MSNISTNIKQLLNWHHPTKVYFGQSVLLQLSKLIEENFPSVKNVLIVTGKYHLKSNEYFIPLSDSIDIKAEIKK